MIKICPAVIFFLVFCKDLFLAFLLFLININNLSDGLQSNLKLFADDTLLFETVHNINKARNNLSNELTKSTKWVHQWKMSFNTNISKFSAKGP